MKRLFLCLVALLGLCSRPAPRAASPTYACALHVGASFPPLCDSQGRFEVLVEEPLPKP